MRRNPSFISISQCCNFEKQIKQKETKNKMLNWADFYNRKNAR
nr:MAG TPA: hypothetical protein [Caudoviricetes sp.]